jgi:acyl carrier protein
MNSTPLSEKDTKAVFDLLIEQLDVQPEQLTHDAAIMEDLCADSLDIMEIIMGVEEQFGVTIPDEMAEKVSTVGDLLETLAELLNEDNAVGTHRSLQAK